MSEQRVRDTEAPYTAEDAFREIIALAEKADQPVIALIASGGLRIASQYAPLTGQALSEAQADEQRRMFVHDKHIIDGVKRMLERVQLEGLGRSCLDQANPEAEERAWKFAISTALNALARGEWRQP